MHARARSAHLVDEGLAGEDEGELHAEVVHGRPQLAVAARRDASAIRNIKYFLDYIFLIT